MQTFSFLQDKSLAHVKKESAANKACLLTDLVGKIVGEIIM